MKTPRIGHDAEADFESAHNALRREVERVSGLGWDDVIVRVKSCLLDEIEKQYRIAFLNLVAADEAEAIEIIGNALGKPDYQIDHWQNPDPKYSPIGFVMIWQGFAALNQVFGRSAIPPGRTIVKQAIWGTISSICVEVLRVRKWDKAQEIALMETGKTYWDEARMLPERRERAVKQLLRSVESFTGTRLRWNFEQIERWRLAWDSAWAIYWSADNFTWAKHDATP